MMGILFVLFGLWLVGFCSIGSGVDQLWGNGWATLAVGVYSGLSAFVLFVRLKVSYRKGV